MKDAMAAAEKFIASVEKQGYEEAIAKLNERYGNDDDKEPFKLDKLEGFRQILDSDIEIFDMHAQGNPLAMALRKDQIMRKAFYETMESLVGDNEEGIAQTPLVVEFKPSASCYVIKELSQNVFTNSEYDNMKGQFAYMLEDAQSQSLAVSHFMPDNLVKRMGFRWADADETSAEPNETPSGDGDS